MRGDSPPISVDIRGLPEVKAALDKLDGAPMKRTLQAASTAGAKALKKPVQSAIGPASGIKGPMTGRLRKSISSRQARKDRPAAVVSARPRKAFYRHMVIGGTKAHGPKAGNRYLIFRPRGSQKNVMVPRVKGTSSRPFISIGYARGKNAAERAIDKVMDEYLASL